MVTARRHVETVLETRSASFVLISLFPRLAKVAYAPGYLGARGVAVYVVARTLFLLALPRWAGPALQRWSAAVMRERYALRDSLGRDPTDDEFVRHRAQERRRRMSARRAGRP